MSLVLICFDLKVCKNQLASMLSAGVNSTCRFSVLVQNEFLAHNWRKQNLWNIKKLWNGTIDREYQLGKHEWPALKRMLNKNNSIYDQ